MSGSTRVQLITKLDEELRKRYTVPPISPRPLLEHALYGCLLEDCPSDLAEEGLIKCEQDFFDWNEVRVTTVTELSGVLSSMPEPAKSAARLKGVLQSIFEEFYSFDLEYLKKENLGKASAQFESLSVMTPFVLSHIIQHGLGGHAIPIDYSAMVIMMVTGIASRSEAQSGKVPGLERAISKSNGVEFGALLHQPAVALSQDPADADARALLEAVVTGSAATMDDYLHNKDVARKNAMEKLNEEKEAAKSAPGGVSKSVPTKATPKKVKEAIAAAASEAIEVIKPQTTAAKAESAAKGKKVTESKVDPKSSKKKPVEKKPVDRKPADKKTAEKKSAAKRSDLKKGPAAAKVADKVADNAAPKAADKVTDQSAPTGKSSKPKPAAKSKPVDNGKATDQEKMIDQAKSPAAKSKPPKAAVNKKKAGGGKNEKKLSPKSATPESQAESVGVAEEGPKMSKRKPR